MKQIELRYSLPIFEEDNKTQKKDAEDNKLFSQYHVNMMVPEGFDEAGQIYGKEIFYAKGMAQIIIDARRLCYKAKTEAEAQEFVNKWMPGLSTAKSTGLTKKEIAELTQDFSEDEMREMIEIIRSKRGEK